MVLQSGCHHLAEGLLLGGGSILFGPVGGFLQLTLKVPSDKGNDEQNQEQQAGCQHTVKRAVGACGEQGGAIGFEAGDDEAHNQRKDEDDGRTAAPCELADADVGSALCGGRRLGDIAPGSGNASAYGKAGEHNAYYDHGQVHGNHGDEYAGSVNQQIVLINSGAAELVGQEAADQCANCSAEGVCADSAQDCGPGRAEVECSGPSGKGKAAGYDAARVKEVGQGNRHGSLAFLGKRQCFTFLVEVECAGQVYGNGRIVRIRFHDACHEIPPFLANIGLGGLGIAFGVVKLDISEEDVGFLVDENGVVVPTVFVEHVGHFGPQFVVTLLVLFGKARIELHLEA